jgi:DNA-binding NarL/FixJ family response regulator
MTKKILIADDHQVVRIGTAMVLEKHFPHILIDYAENYYQVKEKVSNDKFDLVILDIEMKGSIYKFMIQELKMIKSDLRILIFSSSDEGIALDYIVEGADGYLNKLVDDETFFKAVRSIFDNGHYYPASIIQMLASRTEKKDPKKTLSEREFQVFKLLAEGAGNIEVSNTLNIQVSTAGTYKDRIYKKLGVKNLIELFKIYKNLD